jgi:outer membrane protein insertion porin family
MSSGKPNLYRHLLKAIVAGLFISTGFSCVIVKNYPPSKPFVYETKINLQGNFSNTERDELISRLNSQLDDSMRPRSISKVLWSVMKNPPAYDSTSADKSVIFMRALLNALGYFRDTITYDTTVKIVKNDQYRTTVTFDVIPGKVVRLDSITFNIKQQELQSITEANIKDSYLKKGDPFAKAPVSVELDRLVDLYRNQGYLRFTRDELIGLWDTLDVSLLQPTLDPFEQLEILQKLKERRENPTANLEIRLRPGFDTSKLVKYFIGNIYVYPDYSADTAGYSRKEVMVNDVKVIYYRNMFRPKIFPQNIFLYKDSLYSQQNYLRTVNRFNSLGSWRLTSIDQVPRKDQDTVDFIIRLGPAKKYSFTANLEGSRNSSAVSGNLFGLAINVGLQNRNFARSANNALTNIRFGIELGDSSLVQTRQFSFSHSIYFPRPILISRLIRGKLKENAKTIFSFSAANTERLDLYNLTTINGSFGYDFQLTKKLLLARYPNIEYSNLNARAKLIELFNSNPSLRSIFTDGFIESIIGGLTITGGNNRSLNVLRFNVEKSGLVTTLINSDFLDTNLYRFLKLDAELTWKLQNRKSAFVFRFFGGVGIESSATINPLKKNNLPFFKQYFAGGPNSMRAWQLRRLGPGSVIKDFQNNPERYGDVQLEANIEWRFPITNFSGVKLNGALFTDIGNIWLLKGKGTLDKEEVFSFSRLGTDLAIGAGAGFRVDFSFFVIRFDYAYKVKDPSPAPFNASSQNKLFYNWKLFNGQFQLGISYPFIL